MNWIIFSIIPPFLWAVSNYVDKFLIEKYFKKSAGASLMLLIVSFGLLFAPFIYIFRHGAIHVGIGGLAILFISSCLALVSWILYAKALSEDDVSVVVPLFQLMPVYNYFLGLIFLGEKLSTMQILASVIIVCGSILISLNFEQKKIHFKLKVVLPMLLCTLIFSINVLIIKSVMLKSDFWSVNFWSYLFFGIIAVTLLIATKPWREEVGTAIKRNFSEAIGVSFLNEALDFSATMIYRYAMLMAPIALVSVLANGFQPVFILIMGVILSIFLPRFSGESLAKHHLVQRTVAIFIIFFGTYLLNK